MHLELIKYCSFGYQCPVALLEIDHSKQVYTEEGVKSLIKQTPSNSEAASILRSIYNKLQQLKYMEIDEISWDDISGQNQLF
jgi:hypothetical protein